MNPTETKLIFLAPGDILKGRVEPIMWMRMCQSFSNMGLSIELVTVYTYRKENIRRQQIGKHYGTIEPNFKLTILPTPLTINTPTWWSRACLLTANFVYGLAINMQRKEHRRYQQLIFYSRSPAAIYPYWTMRKLFEGINRPIFILETHALPVHPEAIAVLRRMDGVVASSQKLAQDMQAQLGIKKERLHVSYLAPHALPSNLSQQEARRELGLSVNQDYIVYTGKLLMDEVSLILDTAEILDNEVHNVKFLFVGGNPDILPKCQAEMQQRDLSNVRFLGFVPPAKVALYQVMADILLAYYTTRTPTLAYMTPAKLFDYLQAGRPMIVSDYPILHEIVQHNRNAWLVQPENPPALADGILLLIRDAALAKRIAHQARLDSQQYTWEQRTRSIWDFIKRIDSQVLSG